MCCPPSPRLTELLLPPELLQSLVHLLQQETRQQRLVLQQLQQQLGAGSNSFFGLAGAAAVALSAGSKEGLLQREWFVSRWMPTECCVAAAAATAESMQSSKAPWWASFVGDVAAQVLLWCSTACSLSPSVAGGVQGPSFLRQLQHAQQQQHEDTAAPGQKKPAEEAAAGESVTAPAGAAQAAGYEQLQLCCGALPVLQQLQHATERLPGPYAYLCLLAQRQQLCLRWLLFAAAAAPLPTAAALYPWCCSTRTWSEATLQLMRALQQPHKKPKRILLGGSTCSLPLPPDAFVRDAVLLPTLQFVSLFYPGGVSRETDRAGSCGEKSKTAAQEGKDAGGLSAAAGVSNTAAAIAAAGGGVASLLPVAIPLLQQLQQGCNNNSSWVASFVDFLSLLLQHWAPSATPLFVASVSAAFAAIALLQLLLQPSQLFLGNAKAASGNVQPPRASSAGAAATWEKATLPDTAGEPGAAPTSAAHAAQALLNWGVSLSVYCSSHLLNWVILERGGYAVRVGLCSKSNRTGPFRVYIHPDKCSTMHGATQLPLSPLLTGALLQSQMLVLMVLQHPERYGYSLPGKLGTLSSAINSLASAAAGGPPSVQQVQQEPSMVTGLKELQHNFHLPQDQPQPEFVAQSAAWRRLLQRQTCNLLGPSANPYTVRCCLIESSLHGSTEETERRTATAAAATASCISIGVQLQLPPVSSRVAAELAAATAATAAALAAADDISPHTGGDVSAGRRELTRRLEVCSAAELLLRLTAEHHRQQAGSLTVAAATAATLSALLVVTPGGTSQAAAEPRGGLVKRRRIYCNSNHSSSKTHAATTHVDGNASPLPLRTEALCSGMVLLLLHWWPFSSGRGCSSQKHSETSVAAALPTATDTALPEGCWAASGATNACTQHRGSRGADGDSSECQECSGSTAASKSNTYSEGSLHASSRFFDATFGLWLAYANAAAGNPLTGCGSQERQRKQQHQQQDQLEALLERDVALARPFILANAVADLRGSWLPAAVPSTFGRWMPLIDEHEDLLCSPLGDPGVFVAKGAQSRGTSSHASHRSSDNCRLSCLPSATLALEDGGLGGSFGAPPCCSTCSGGESDRQWLLRMWKAIQQGFSPLAFPSGSSSESVEAPLVLLHPLQLPLDAPATCCTGVGVGSAPSAALLRALEEVKDSAIRMLLQLPAAEARVTTALFQQQKPAGKHQQHVLQWAVQNPGAVLHVCNEVLGDLQRAAPERWQQVSAGAVALHVPLHSLLPVLLHGGPHPLLVGPLLWFVLLLGLLAAAGSSSDLLLIPPRNNTGSSNASSSSEASDCPCGAAGSPVDSLADIAWSLLLIWFERTPWLLLHAFRCLKRLPRSSGHKQQQQPQVFSAGKENSGSPLPWPTLRTSFGSFCSRRSVLGRMMRLPSIFALRAPLGAGGYLARMESPEMRISINRKIAQLTRVIQRLSTTQEDHELHLQRLTDAYEQEIEEIILEANAKLSACGRAAREAHISKVTDAEVTELKQKLLAASAAAACELTKYKAALDAETLKKQEQWDKQLSKVQSKASALFVEHLPPKGRQSLLPLTALLLVAVVPSLMAALFSLLAFLHPFDFLCSFLASGEWRCWQSSLATASDALRKASEEFEASHEVVWNRILVDSTELYADPYEQHCGQQLDEGISYRRREAHKLPQRTSGQQHQKLEAELQRVQRLRHEEQQGHEKAVTLLERELTEVRGKAKRAEEASLRVEEEFSRMQSLLAQQLAEREALERELQSLRKHVKELQETLEIAKEQEVAVDLLSERELRVAAARSYDQMISAMEQDGLEKEAKLQQLVERCKELEGLLEETALQSTERLKEKGDACQQQLERQKQELHDAYLANRRLHEKAT
ncbi:hypothetical protein cyc_06355 [Cyclospora cayetanensis]|uniref:Uncharacterized protein n=1 Tax=Cyclospora cayetanensis TaxID=88456 RepID=A0A1D3DAL9_9EIME|nr:hypothetical protein cyc_06355 [Cyclospora cayetanensis]